MAENLSAVLHGAKDIQLENRPLSTPGDDQVLIRIASVGICGTDLSIWKNGKLGELIVEQPFVIGHEASGVVERVGRRVTHLAEGDQVAVEPLITCYHCSNCKSGKYNLCDNLKVSGIPTEDGSMCRYKVHNADFCHKLPDHVSLEEGALTEPLAIAVHACRRGEISLGHTVLVVGAGPIGLLSVAVARSMGASKIVVTDVNKSRLDVAMELGACNTLLFDPLQGSCGEIAAKLAEALGRSPDVTIECSGSESGITLAIDATKKGGKVILVGLGAETVSVPMLHATCRQVDLLPVWCYANCFPAAVALLESRAVDLLPIITNQFRMEDIQEAFELITSGAQGVIKVLIQCQSNNLLELRRASMSVNSWATASSDSSHLHVNKS